jgi:hypothetical protein
MKSENKSERNDVYRRLFLPNGAEVIEIVDRAIPYLPKYQYRPAAADIAFCVAAYANGMTEDLVKRALEDDYLSRDPSASKGAAYIRRTMERARRWTER